MTSPAVSFRRTARRHYHADALRTLHSANLAVHWLARAARCSYRYRRCSAPGARGALQWRAIIRQYVRCHPECDVLYQPHFSDFLALPGSPPPPLLQCCCTSVGALRCTDGSVVLLHSGEQKGRSLLLKAFKPYFPMQGRVQVKDRKTREQTWISKE